MNCLVNPTVNRNVENVEEEINSGILKIIKRWKESSKLWKRGCSF